MVHGCGIEPREILASQGKPLILMRTLTSEAVLDPEFGSWENRCKQVYGVAALAIFCLHVEQFQLRPQLNVSKLIDFEGQLPTFNIFKKSNYGIRVDEAFAWLCRQRKAWPDSADLWDFRRH